MSIVSLQFMGLVLALVLFYFTLPKKCQWVVLLLASILFYVSGGLKGCLYIVVTIVSQYILARVLGSKYEKTEAVLAAKGGKDGDKKVIRHKYTVAKRWIVTLCVVINLGIMFFLKLADPAISELNKLFGMELKELDLLLPIGLSYYTFKSVGYVIDVGRGRVPAEKNIFKLALYIGYFPALVQGPIDRYEDLAGQLTAEHKFSYERLCFGAQRMLWGYIKKLVIADRIAVIVNQVIKNYQTQGYVGFVVFIGVALYAFQVYADFSGGMDIVIGLSEIFGIQLTENFRRPFFATSVAEYWQRWHITLGAWMRTYVFYPLSLSKPFNKLGKVCRNVFGDRFGKLVAPSLASFLTFVLIGIWHGTGWKYVLYGLYMAVFVSTATLLEPLYEDMRNRLKIDPNAAGLHVFQSIRTFVIIVISRFVNPAKDVPDMVRMLKAAFTHFNPWVLVDGSLYRLGLDRPNFWLMIASIVMLLVIDAVQERGIRIRETIAKKNIVLRWAIYYGAIFALLIFGMYGPDYDASSFIYQRF